MTTAEEERKLFYRECVAVFVLELLDAFANDTETIEAWLFLPTEQDQVEFRRELECFRSIMQNIELECSKKRDGLAQTAA